MHASRLPHPNVPESLNESPSEKEGKWPVLPESLEVLAPSMKVPPKRKGNLVGLTSFTIEKVPQ